MADRTALKEPPLQQVWRDHLLAGALVAANVGYDEGALVFLAASGDVAHRRAVYTYRRPLVGDASFAAWTLEAVVAGLRTTTDARWVGELDTGYLDFDSIPEHV